MANYKFIRRNGNIVFIETRNFSEMNGENIPFQKIDWTRVPKTKHEGETGIAYWQTLEIGGLRIRLVEYSADYVADHWCQKGHIVHCLEGAVINEQENAPNSILTPGTSNADERCTNVRLRNDSPDPTIGSLGTFNRYRRDVELLLQSTA